MSDIGRATTAVEVVSSHRDALDWFAGVGGLVGAVVAIAAFLLALRSARDAARSANAAVESLKIMREEARTAKEERSRRAAPTITLSAQAIGTTPNTPPTIIELSMGFVNAGDRATEHLYVNFLLPDFLNWRICDQTGNETSEGAI